jgi:hypothetical protein
MGGVTRERLRGSLIIGQFNELPMRRRGDPQRKFVAYVGSRHSSRSSSDSVPAWADSQRPAWMRTVGGAIHDGCVASFDITSILDFQPPRRFCPACRGLVSQFKREYTKEWKLHSESCPVCGVIYVKDDSPWAGEGSFEQHLKTEGLIWDHRDLFNHASTLAKVVRDSRGSTWQEPWPTMRTFFEVISRAKYFVHFTSWGISHVMIGALKMASMRVPVYGFVSDVESHARAELTEFPTEAPMLKAQAIPSSQGIYDAPHQKILIIDGLVAFKGSTNLTNAGPRRADRALDVSEIVTDFDQVTQLNNRYFAPVWRRITAPEGTWSWSPAPF